MRYNPHLIEKKWQKQWKAERIYEPDFRRAKKPFYNLMMFPYPSAEGLHIGAVRTFSGVDVYGRFKRMQGRDVFEPIGLDGFGIHSENYALKIGKHPLRHAKDSEKNFYRQLRNIGNGFAWEEKVETYDPNYYKWTQWIFVQMFKRGLAYRKKAEVNWCPSCMTVLADEQVIKKSKIKNQNTKLQPQIQKDSNEEMTVNVCERCETSVIRKELEQWFFKITDYAERLLKNLNKIDWPEPIKIVQKNWIGKSEGALIKFEIRNPRFERGSPPAAKSKTNSKFQIQNSKQFIEVFTTRPDTLFGATYIVVAPEHPVIKNFQFSIFNFQKVNDYVQKAKAKTEEERIAEGREKTGVELKGIKAVNPANKEKIPIWVADYVLGHVGTGAIMAVPAHDERDFEFAKKYNLSIRIVVCPHYPEKTCPILDRAYGGGGHLVASGKFDGMQSEKAKWEITKFVGGEKKVQYRLRDWLISRQRYWGPPIPIIYCRRCWEVQGSKVKVKSLRYGVDYATFGGEEFMIHLVSEKDLPVKLPYIKNFKPTGSTYAGPLAAYPKFYKVHCPKCGARALRETDVSDAFLDSSWYYLGYLMASENWKLKIGNYALAKLTRQWLPVHMYIGGAEHSVLHLLYSRFIAMVLHDLGMFNFEEPFQKFVAHGLITKDGAKMSKSRGNVVNPDEYIHAYGIDAIRMYLAFLAPLTQGGDFRDTGIRGLTRFLERVWRFCHDFSRRQTRSELSESHPNYPNSKSRNSEHSDAFVDLGRIVHRTIKKVTEDIEELQYNTAISALMVLLNEFEANVGAVTREHINIFLKLLAPFAPFISEELWRGILKRSGSIHVERWPKFDPKLIREEMFELVIQINGKVKGRVALPRDVNEEGVTQAALGVENIRKQVSDKMKKIIFVPNRLINFVV